MERLANPADAGRRTLPRRTRPRHRRGTVRRRLTSRTVLAACLSVVAACGSTADFSVPVGSGGVTANELGGGIEVGPGATSDVGGTRAAAPGALAGSGYGAADGPGGVTGSGPSATGGTAAAPGVTASAGPAKTASIRLTYLVQDTTGASALTGSQVNGDNDVAKRTMQALVDYANEHGGVDGRKIIAKSYTLKATSEESERLAACKEITEDQRAEVFLDSNTMITEPIWSCFAQHRTAYFGTVTATDRTFLARTAPYVTTTYLSLDRQMKAIVDGSNHVGFFNNGKLGIILPDEPTAHRDYERVLKPALARIGITDQQVRYISNDRGSGQQAQTNNAVLAFSSSGVNRILFFHHILVYLQFTNQADSQQYHPHYAFPDYQLISGVAAYYGDSSQNRNSIAVSSFTVEDDNSRKSTDNSSKIDRSEASPGERRCLDILSKQTGIDYYDPQKSGDSVQAWRYYCDEFFLWWESAKKVGAGWTSASTGAGLRAIGKNYLSTTQHSVDFSSGHNDGASSYRVGKYDASCKCYVKATPWLSIAS